MDLLPLNYFLTIQAPSLSLAHLSFQLLPFSSGTMAATGPSCLGLCNVCPYSQVPRLGPGFVPLARQPVFHLPISPFCTI